MLKDEVRIRHMIDAAREAMAFARARVREDLDQDRQLALSLVKLIEIIGEAAATVTEETCRRAPAIPWRSIVGMRHRLVHGYFEIDLDRVWDTVVDDLPALLPELESLLEILGQPNEEP